MRGKRHAKQASDVNRRRIRMSPAAAAGPALAIALAAAGPAQAQTWLGNDATNPTNFNLGANWSTGNAPGYGDTATFAGGGASQTVNVTQTADLGAGGLLFNAAAPAYTINIEQVLLLTNITNNSGVAQTINVGQSYLHVLNPGVASAVTINQSGTGVVQFDTTYDASAAFFTASGTNGAILVRGDGTTVSLGSLNSVGNGRISFEGNGSMIEVGALDQNDTFSGYFTTQGAGTGGLRKVGTGTLTLNLTKPTGTVGEYTGPTEVVAGTLNMRSSASFGTADSGTSVASGATLSLSGGSYSVADALSLAGNGVNGGGALRNIENFHTVIGGITLTDAARVNSDAGMLTLSGPISRTNQSLTFGGAGNVTVSGTIGGSGDVIKDGSGSLTLSGSNNDYLGLTTVREGRLLGGAVNAFSPGSFMAISQAGTVDLNGFDQTVMGLVTLVPGQQSGDILLTDATLTLGGDSSHFFISVFEGNISGTGGVIKEGAYDQRLGGSNTYAGATTINQGSIIANSTNAFSANSAHVVAAGAALHLDDRDQEIGSLAGGGDVDLGLATLTVGGDDTSTTFSGVMSGNGGFDKKGTGTQTFTGANTYTGATNVDDGTLVVGVGGAGSIVSDVTVGGAGTLMGTGALGGVTVQSGGVHAPGNSIGTQTVNGPYLLQAGAILEIETNAAGQSDLVVVNGTVDITGATLRVLADGGNYAIATDYLIIDNDGGDAVIGTFAPITSNLAFLNPAVVYNGGDGNDVVLTLTRNDVSFTDVAQTPNQFATATGVGSLPVTNPLVIALFGQSAEGARQALDALSGEVHTTVGTVLTNDSRFIRRTIFNRMQQASGISAQDGSTQVAASGTNTPVTVAGSFDAPMALGMDGGRGASGYDIPAAPSPLVFWTQGFGSWGDFDSNGNAATANRTIGGFLSGVDAELNDGWRAGLALGYSHSSVGVGARLSSANIDSYHLALYTGGTAGAVALRGGGAWSWNDIDSKRTVAFPGFFDRVDASYNGDVGQLFAEAALPLHAGAVAYEPFANVAYVHVSTDRFTEQGGAAALDGFAANTSTGFTTLGLRVTGNAMFGDARIVPRASFGWQYAFGDINPVQALAFNAGGSAFGIAGVPLARNAALIDAGFDLFLAPDATLSLSYNGELAGDIEDHGVSGRLNWRF